MTAETARGAAVQCPVWAGLLTASVFAVSVDDAPQWWLTIGIWTIGLIASSMTLLALSGLVSHGAARAPMTPAGAIAWGMRAAVLGAISATSLVVWISTGSAAFLVGALLAAAAAIGVTARGAQRSISHA